MTEVVSSVENQDVGINNAAPAQSNPAQNVERTFTQSEVNDLVGRVKHEERERNARREMPNYSAPQHYTNHVPANNASQNFQQNNLSEDHTRKMIAEETQKLFDQRSAESRQNAAEQESQRIANEFFQKIEVGKKEFQDFDKVMSNVDLRVIPFHVQLANLVDNTAAVMYELANNPSKIGSIQNLIDIDIRAGGQPKLALAEIVKLSESLKANKQAKNFEHAKEPLDQMQPSNHGTGSGIRSISELRKDPIYRR